MNGVPRMIGRTVVCGIEFQLLDNGKVQITPEAQEVGDRLFAALKARKDLKGYCDLVSAIETIRTPGYRWQPVERPS
jgi:hypothetical protein